MRVLYATDGGTPATQALELLLRAADPAKAGVTVVTVGSHPLPSEAPALVPGFTDEATRQLQEAGFAAESRSLDGRPGPSIVTELESGNYELAVLGAGNRSWLGRLLLGSVSTKVLHAAPTSVLIVHQASDLQAPIRVLLGTDGTSHAEQALGQITGLLNPAACLIEVVSVAEYLMPQISFPAPGAAYAISAPSPEQEEEWLASARVIATRAAEQLESAGFKAEANAILGAAALRLLAEIEKHGSDLVVVGERGLGAIAKAALGSVSDQIVRNAPATLVAR